MGVSNQGRNERGVALLLSLIILLVLTMLGVSAFHNSHIQERSAGNMRLQSVAFEAAAAGASNAINFFDANRALGPDQLCGSLGHEGWVAPTAWVSANAVGEATLKQRMYCLADEYPAGADEDDICEDEDVECRPARSQLFVLSRGEVLSGGNVVAQRDVEIRLDIGGGGGVGDGCGALCFPSCSPGTFDFGTSNAFQVDGNGGPAITGACQNMTNAILDGIQENRIGNYIGGVDTTSPDAPWDDPDTVEDFRATVEAKAMADNSSGTCMTYCYNASTAYHFGNPAFGTPADPQVTYIAGNAYFGGNVSGAGIMFVNGNLHWNGTPKFEGLIVTLGGTFTVSGGGLGGDHAGSVVILNASGNGTFGNSNLYNTGGGTALYRFDCGALWAAWETLDADGQALWSPNCEVGPASPYGAGPGELIVASWRENIGWREHFFGSD